MYPIPFINFSIALSMKTGIRDSWGKANIRADLINKILKYEEKILWLSAKFLLIKMPWMHKLTTETNWDGQKHTKSAKYPYHFHLLSISLNFLRWFWFSSKLGTPEQDKLHLSHLFFFRWMTTKSNVHPWKQILSLHFHFTWTSKIPYAEAMNGCSINRNVGLPIGDKQYSMINYILVRHILIHVATLWLDFSAINKYDGGRNM